MAMGETASIAESVGVGNTGVEMGVGFITSGEGVGKREVGVSDGVIAIGVASGWSLCRREGGSAPQAIRLNVPTNRQMINPRIIFPFLTAKTVNIAPSSSDTVLDQYPCQDTTRNL